MIEVGLVHRKGDLIKVCPSVQLDIVLHLDSIIGELGVITKVPDDDLSLEVYIFKNSRIYRLYTWQIEIISN